MHIMDVYLPPSPCISWRSCGALARVRCCRNEKCGPLEASETASMCVRTRHACRKKAEDYRGCCAAPSRLSYIRRIGYRSSLGRRRSLGRAPSSRAGRFRQETRLLFLRCWWCHKLLRKGTLGYSSDHWSKLWWPGFLRGGRRR